MKRRTVRKIKRVLRSASVLAVLTFISACLVYATVVTIGDASEQTQAFATTEKVYGDLSRRYLADEEILAAEPDDTTDTIETGEDDEQETSEEDAVREQETVIETSRDENPAETSGNERVSETSALETKSEVVQGAERRVSGMGTVLYKAYGIWTGAYWNFTPEQIDAQWRGLKSYKPQLPEGTTRAWQKYLYDRLAGIGAEWFYKYAVAQAMQESGFNPLNQYGNDAIPDKGLYSFRIWYWNAAYGDVYDYHANINAYVDRIAPYLTDSSEAGIYRAISQHYQPNGATNMTYVNMVLGRLNELWEVE